MMTGRKVWVLIMAMAVILPSIATAGTEEFQQKLNGFWIQDKINTKGGKYTKPFAIHEGVWSQIVETWKTREYKEKDRDLYLFSYFEIIDAGEDSATMFFGHERYNKKIRFIDNDTIEVSLAPTVKNILRRHKGAEYDHLLPELAALNKMTPATVMQHSFKNLCLSVWDKLEIKKLEKQLGGNYRLQEEYKRVNDPFREKQQTLQNYVKSMNFYYSWSEMKKVPKVILGETLAKAKSSPKDEQFCTQLANSIEGFAKEDIQYKSVTGPKLF